MVSWMTLDELEGANKKRFYKGTAGQTMSTTFKYRQPFGINFRYRHQVDDQNNRRHAPIYLERTLATKFWLDRNFDWYLAASEVNADIAMGHFQNGGVLQPSLDFRRGLAKECLENTIGLDPGDIGRPQRGCTIPAGLECQLVSVSHYCGMWDGGSKK